MKRIFDEAKMISCTLTITILCEEFSQARRGTVYNP